MPNKNICCGIRLITFAMLVSILNSEYDDVTKCKYYTVK